MTVGNKGVLYKHIIIASNLIIPYHSYWCHWTKMEYSKFYQYFRQTTSYFMNNRIVINDNLHFILLCINFKNNTRNFNYYFQQLLPLFRNQKKTQQFKVIEKKVYAKRAPVSILYFAQNISTMTYPLPSLDVENCRTYNRSILEHCTLTNKAMGTIWRDLSKPPQRRQGPDPRPLWLLVWTPLVLGPELASRRAEHSLLWRMPLYIFLIYVFITVHVCVIIFMAAPSWLLVLGLYKEDYLQIFKCVSFWLHGFCGKWEGWDPVNRFNHTNRMDVVRCHFNWPS